MEIFIRETDDPKTYSVLVGQSLVIELSEGMDGFIWSLVTLKLDALQLVNQSIKPNEEGRVGAGRVRAFHFISVDVGINIIKFSCARPFDPENPVEFFFPWNSS